MAMSEEDVLNGLFLLVSARVENTLREMCPSAIDLLHAKGGVKRSMKWKSSSDYSTAICRCSYNRYLSNKPKSTGAESNETDESEDVDVQGTITVSMVSSLGVDRTRKYNSADELAEAFVLKISEIENDACCNGGGMERKVIADVRVLPGGVVSICTLRHMEWQRVRDQLFCTDCGSFFNGERGLRDHQLVKHGNSYEVAMECVAADKAQLIQYTSDGAEIERWEKEYGLEKRARDELGDEGLEAARSGDLDALKTAVASGWNPHKACDKHGSGALHWAAGEGHLHICNYLTCECGVTYEDLSGPHRKRRRSALHWAARNGKLEVVKWLVRDMKLEADIGTSDGTTPFMYAVWQGHMEVCEWLSTDGGCNIAAVNDFGCNAIQWCVQTGDVDMCQWLLDRGLDILLCNRNGHSALHKAAVKGQMDACKWLVGTGGLGLPQMQPDSDGNDPAEMARLESYNSVACYLREQKERLLLEAQLTSK